ncbi:MAG: 5-amino-6-(D-ribitylamino)uracil--L-tyrosine 4-hydroxyphenyl transferase CofH [Hyphomicrobiales bacterium]|nr:5-amino-6-(D-ribitylamino)uracil--L-tyrosine 4-hydroxyphenyl transferase CofH [Hyphomicrobiales bacterium]MBV8826313.1 5-amino-6-(D-ribitylamino)uracil--L-tyrosine 4-hydroxyphenyl transferase CofH [Hyphomicrobiales bacterium]
MNAHERPIAARESTTVWDAEAERLLADYDRAPLPELLASAQALGREGHGNVVSYSRKVFIPLTRLCRDVCGYCTFATTPRQAGSAYLTPDEVLAIARAGRAAGCHEALFTLGDKPEQRYAAARSALARLGYTSTIEYLAAMCALVLAETGLLPHVNAGVMTEDEIAALRRVSVSQGIMLESVAQRLCEPGGPHFGSPDKDPQVRLAMIAAAGRQRVPFTSGILIGIGETRHERIASLLALRDVHARHGHLQEVIVQNFRAKPGTRMAGCAEPPLDDVLWTAAVARLILGPGMNIQVPPNLSFAEFPRLLEAGINDWGGISPVTADHVNPEAPWPQIATLERATAAAGYTLVPRLAVYPEYAVTPERWVDAGLVKRVLDAIDTTGFAREDDWVPGDLAPPPAKASSLPSPASGRTMERAAPHSTTAILTRVARGEQLSQTDIVRLFAARGPEVEEICAAADALRARVSGDVVTYVVNRNINYTNVCSYACSFCAFSKGKLHDHLRGRPYDLALEEIARRTEEAWQRGATEVCLQGGIHPAYTGDTYLTLLRTVKEAVPRMHVHAFSPLEISHGAQTLGVSLATYLECLQKNGLGSLPGTAAEILDDAVRARICPDKLNTREWLEVVGTAHEVGLRTTATIMFGHVEDTRSWAAHLLRLRDLQERTGGFTEFVPLPFVHMEAPMYLKSGARRGPTWRETMLMHAVARLALHPLVANIQASWVKAGPAGVARLLAAGVNDCGGTLMNESISRAAGTQHGQEHPPEAMEAMIGAAGRTPRQRTTLYRGVDPEQTRLSFDAPPLAPVVQTPVRRRGSPMSSYPPVVIVRESGRSSNH